MPTRRWLSPIDLWVLYRVARRWVIGGAIFTLPLLAGLVDWTAGPQHDAPNGWGVVCIVAWIVAGLGGLAAAFLADRDDIGGPSWSSKISDVHASRVTRWRRRAVVAVPDGEWVTLWLCERGGRVERHRLHAESEADRAHQLVAEFRTQRDQTPSDDAIALARTLAR